MTASIEMDRTSIEADKSLYQKFMGLAFGTGLAYAIFCAFYNIASISGPRLNREIFTWIAAVGLGFLYVHSHKALKAALAKPDADYGRLFKTVAVFAAVFGIMAILTPNFHSTDLFGYINRGWQQWHYGTNPYVTVIDEISGWQKDPIITNHWAANPSPYGFLYIAFAKALCGIGDFIAPGQKQALVYLFKLSNFLILGATATMITRVLRKIRGEAAALEGLFLLVWNPLLLIHTLMNGHNDVVMGGLMAAAGCCSLYGEFKPGHEKRYWVWMLPLLMAATLIKYAALVIIPFAILFLWRKKAYQTLFVSLLISAAIFAGIGFNYLKDWRQFKLGAIQYNAQISHSSLHSFFYHLYKNISALFPSLKPYHNTVKHALKTILMSVYGILLLRWLVNRCTSNLPQRLETLKFKKLPLLSPKSDFNANAFIEISCYVVGALICLVTFKFYCWYLAMVYPMAMLLQGEHWFKRLLTWLTISHLLSITLIGQAHVLNYFLMVLVPIGLFFWRNNRQKRLVTQPAL